MKNYLHIGQDTVILSSEIAGIFDLDNCTVSKNTRDFLTRAEKEKRVVTASEELPKSFIVCRESGKDIIYISPISSQTLLKRKGRL